MNKEEIFEQLDRTRERLLVALEPLPDEALLEPGVMDSWTMSDILAHLTAWESELVTSLQRINQGKKPARLLAALADVDGYNELRFEENKDRDLNRIFDDLRALRLQLEEWLAIFTDRDLSDPNRYDWSDGHPLWRLVEGNSFGHELQHLPQIEDYSSRWQAKYKL
jgi:hypothetical protein